MNKEFIPYEQALALKELGFDKPCLMYYDYSWTLVESGVYECKAPLYQQAFRWFREKYGFNISITSDGYVALDMKKSQPYIDEADSYEEAELECLKELIKIVKKQ